MIRISTLLRAFLRRLQFPGEQFPFDPFGRELGHLDDLRDTNPPSTGTFKR
jgi:hypothetical protein